MNKVIILFCVMLLLSGCSKGSESDIPVQSIQQTTQQMQQTQPMQQSQQQQQQQPVYPTEAETTVAIQPSPDMYEQQSQPAGDSVGSLNFSNMPTVKKKQETTEAQQYTQETTTTEAPVQPETNLSATTEFKTVDVTEPETTTEAYTVLETTQAETEAKKFFDENIEEVPASERTAQAGTVYGAYSKNADVLYLNRENAYYRRVIEVPNVIGFSKDAYNNYIINLELFTDNQLKLPKFSKYGYKIPYQYWYDEEQKLLNPLPTAYVLYKDLFYFANEPIVDPYETKEAEKETTSPYGYTEAVTESKPDNSAVSALGLYPDSKTEQKFTDHAREVYERIKADEKKAEARRSQDYELDMKEKEFADSVGLGGYYEDKIGPGYQGVSGQGQKVYYYTEPSTGTRYELSLLQMKELLGSGKWREQNGGK